MLAYVGDNPDVFRFPIVCEGTKPQVAVDATEIKFGRLMRLFRENKNVKLESCASIPLRWKVLPSVLLFLCLSVVSQLRSLAGDWRFRPARVQSVTSRRCA